MLIPRSIKTHAKTLLRNLGSKPILVTLVFFAVTLLMNWICSKASGTLYIIDMDALADGKPYEEIVTFTPQYVNRFGMLLSALIRWLGTVLGAGFTIYTFSLSRRLEASYGTLLDGFGIFLRVIWLEILTGLYVFLWSLLLVIPGIIAAYSYRQAFYLMLDHPDWSCSRCLKESRKLMRGHKFELFSLDFSFLGWNLLASLIPPIILYARPLIGISNAEFYNRLIGVIVPAEANTNEKDPWES